MIFPEALRKILKEKLPRLPKLAKDIEADILKAFAENQRDFVYKMLDETKETHVLMREKARKNAEEKEIKGVVDNV